MSIDLCKNVTIGNLNISAPQDSPNTDGIDISSSTRVQIHDLNIQTGNYFYFLFLKLQIIVTPPTLVISINLVVNDNR